MKLIPGHPNEELQEAASLAEGLRRTTEATVAGTVPLIPEVSRTVTPDQMGLPSSIVGNSLEKQLDEVKAEVAELRAAQRDQPGKHHELIIDGAGPGEAA